jgi:hypothetical protein
MLLAPRHANMCEVIFGLFRFCFGIFDNLTNRIMKLQMVKNISSNKQNKTVLLLNVLATPFLKAF